MSSFGNLDPYGDDPFPQRVYLYGDSLEDVGLRACVVAREYALKQSNLPSELYALICPDLGMICGIGEDIAEREQQVTEWVQAIGNAFTDAKMPPVVYVVWCPDAGAIHGMHADPDFAKFSVQVLNNRKWPHKDSDEPMIFDIIPVEN